MAIVARKMNIKLDPSNYTANTLRQEGCTDMARHGVASWRIEMTGRWSENVRKYVLMQIGEIQQD